MNECPTCEMAATEVQMARSSLMAMRVENERLAANLAACQNLVRVQVDENRTLQTELDRTRKDREYTP